MTPITSSAFLISKLIVDSLARYVQLPHFVTIRTYHRRLHVRWLLLCCECRIPKPPPRCIKSRNSPSEFFDNMLEIFYPTYPLASLCDDTSKQQHILIRLLEISEQIFMNTTFYASLQCRNSSSPVLCLLMLMPAVAGVSPHNQSLTFRQLTTPDRVSCVDVYRGRAQRN